MLALVCLISKEGETMDRLKLTNPELIDIFRLLDQWRHFPAYRLEPQVDPFFALLLPAILEDHSGSAIRPEVIPEFPLRRGTLFGETVRGTNKAKRVDFVVLTQDNETLFLVELKTDMAFRSPIQDQYLKRAQQVGLPALIEDINQLCEKTDKQEKYAHLRICLARLGLLDWTGDGPALQIVYIQPTADTSTEQTITDFAQVARVVEHQGDLGATFAQYLRRWAQQRAGAATS